MTDYQALAAYFVKPDGQPRSRAFINGMAATLQNRVDDTPVVSPYEAGSDADDAFLAGRTRGHAEFRNLCELEGSRANAVNQLQTLSKLLRRAA